MGVGRKRGTEWHGVAWHIPLPRKLTQKPKHGISLARNKTFITYNQIIEHIIKKMYEDGNFKISDLLRPIYLKTLSDNEEYHKHKHRVIEIMTNNGLIEKINAENYNLTLPPK